jgi:hypothetical protein
MAHFDARVWPTCLGLVDVHRCRLGLAEPEHGRPPLVGNDRSLARRSRRCGWGDVGRLEGSTGPRRLVQSLWSGAAAAVHRLACPRSGSGQVDSNADGVVVADGVVMRVVVGIKRRRSPAGGQPMRRARCSVDRVLRDLPFGKKPHNRRIAVRPKDAPRTPGTRR